jgi:hypothetical protein
MLYDYNGSFPNMAYMVSQSIGRVVMQLRTSYLYVLLLQMDPHRLAAVGWTGIVTTVVAIYLEGIALETASASEAALLFASEPVRASLFDVVDDLMTTRQAWTHKKQGYHGFCKQFGFENAVRCKMTSKTNMRRLSTVDCRCA